MRAELFATPAVPRLEATARPVGLPGPGGAASRGSAQAPWQQPCFSPNKMAAVVDAAVAAGASPPALLAGTGLRPAQLRDPDTLTSNAQLYRVLQNALACCDAPGLGWRIGQRLRITSYGMYGYALLCAPSMRAALELATRYHVLANALVPIRYCTRGDVVAWVFPSRAEMDLPGLDERTHRLLIEMQMSVHHTLSRDVMGTDFLPLRALFGWPADASAADTARSLQCPQLFGQPRCELHYASHWLDRAPQLADSLSAAQASRACAQLVHTLAGQTSMARRVYQELTRNPGHFPDVESVAATLCMTGRTLRRHLQAEGVSYAELLARVRLALAEDYLRGTRLGIEDIAHALGFGNARSFRHAFVRWTGQAPSDFRRHA